MNFRQEKIGPEKAKEMLSTMANNRKVKPEAVLRYADDMIAGRWMLSPEPIVFTNGVLVDGQHRLKAVIKSGLSIDFIVCETAQNVMPVLGGGVSRNASDFLGTMGVSQSVLKASIALAIMSYENGSLYIMRKTGGGGGSAKRNISKTRIQEYFFANQDVITRCALYAEHLYKKSSARLLSTSEIGLLYHIFGMGADAEVFLSRVYLGVEVSEKTPEYCLRRILEDRRARTRVITSSDALRYCLLAFEKYKKGHSCERLILPKK